jgi:hypothetical protein
MIINAINKEEKTEITTINHRIGYAFLSEGSGGVTTLA